MQSRNGVLWLALAVALGGAAAVISWQGSHRNPDRMRDALASGGPSIWVRLVDEEQKAKEDSATVQVHVSGFRMVDPDRARGRAVAGQGHLHYRIDQGPAIATTSSKLTFHDLTPGQHTIEVQAVGNDHQRLTDMQKLTITIP